MWQMRAKKWIQELKAIHLGLNSSLEFEVSKIEQILLLLSGGPQKR